MHYKTFTPASCDSFVNCLLRCAGLHFSSDRSPGMPDFQFSAPQLRVLVADDMACSRQQLCDRVQALGHVVASVASGADALAHVMSQQPDLVLLDLLMPDMDGFEVIQRLRAMVTSRWLPVIVTSGLEGEEHFIHALERGADDYLVRPVNPALLRAKLRHYQLVLTEQRRMDRMKDEFLATVSHELRTPLTSIMGALGLLASGAAGALPKAALPLAEVAKRNGERLGQLIDDILDLTKLEGNQMVLQLRPQRLGPLLTEAIAANQGYAERVGVRLVLQSGSDDPLVLVDAGRLLQVLANLLSNAIKHSRSGDSVELGLACSATQVRIKVRDHGPGIDANFRDRLFEKFSQADSTDRRAQGGTGLGLYISRMFVERMGGRMSVDSVAGQGATFMVDFPPADALAAQAAPWVLHIDSDVDARAKVAEWLRPLCPSEGVADLQQARGPFRHVQPPIILADPRAQGSAEEFCSALQQRAAGQQVLLYSDAVDEGFAARAGLVWLPKSTTSRQPLLLAVRSAILQQGKGTGA